MVRTIGFALLWAGFVGYAFFLAPPNQPDTLALIKHLSTGHFEGINPLTIALFNLMGVWPLLYCGLMLFDGRGQSIRAYPFALASFAVGAFAILPYLAFRKPNPQFEGEPSRLLKLVGSRGFGGVLAIASAGLLAYGLLAGNWSDWVSQWQTSRFIHVMSLDFCLLYFLFPALLGDDMARRSITHRGKFRALVLVPVVGAGLYLALRPSLKPTPTPVGSADRSVSVS